MFPFKKPGSASIEFPVECDGADRKILAHVIDNALSMVSRERLFATLMSCRHACEAGIPGAFVECGVWRGGNGIIAAEVFNRFARCERVLLFDTYAGMTEPTAFDFDTRRREPALNRFKEEKRVAQNKWAQALSRRRRPAPLGEVKRHVAEAGIALDRVEFIQGDVLQTLEVAANVPERISVLRLDTDWYESTKKELEVLWPRLSPGGILMIDDYGHWAGAQKAVDEYFTGRRPFLHYIDRTGRLAIKA